MILVKNWRDKLPYKTQLSRFKNIRNRTKRFDELTRTEQRKEIALDVIQLIQDETIAPSVGDYWDDLFEDIHEKSNTAEEFQEELCGVKSGSKCEVCARGAMMLSSIRLGDSINPNDYRFSVISSGSDELGSVEEVPFTVKEMASMELEYEDWSIVDYNLRIIGAVDSHSDTHDLYFYTEENESHVYEDRHKRLLNIFLHFIYSDDDYELSTTDYLKQSKILA